MSLSFRYVQLCKAIEKCLAESRESMDVQAAVVDAYGEDAAIFGGEQVLVDVVHGMMERMHEKITEDTKHALQTKQATLKHVEDIMERLDRSEKDARHAQEQDRASAQKALSVMDNETTACDLVLYHAMECMQTEKEKMSLELQSLEEETKQLEAKWKEATSLVEHRIDRLESTEKDVQQSADMCSMVSC